MSNPAKASLTKAKRFIGPYLKKSRRFLRIHCLGEIASKRPTREPRVKARPSIVQDISRLIAPSAETLITCGAENLDILTENANEEYNDAVLLTEPRPQPNYSTWFRRDPFREAQHRKLLLFIGDCLPGTCPTYDTRHYRHPIRKFDIPVPDEREKWAAYKFTKNVYTWWMPKHFERPIDQLLSGCELDAPPPSEKSRLPQGLESCHLPGLDADLESSKAEPQPATPKFATLEQRAPKRRRRGTSRQPQ